VRRAIAGGRLLVVCRVLSVCYWLGVFACSGAQTDFSFALVTAMASCDELMQ
jgi:hypothetical protein